MDIIHEDIHINKITRNGNKVEVLRIGIVLFNK